MTVGLASLIAIITVSVLVVVIARLRAKQQVRSKHLDHDVEYWQPSRGSDHRSRTTVATPVFETGASFQNLGGCDVTSFDSSSSCSSDGGGGD